MDLTLSGLDPEDCPDSLPGAKLQCNGANALSLGTQILFREEADPFLRFLGAVLGSLVLDLLPGPEFTWLFPGLAKLFLRLPF